MTKDGSDIPPGNIIPLACSESLPSQYPGVSLSASTTTLPPSLCTLLCTSRTQRTRLPLCRSTPFGAPTNGDRAPSSTPNSIIQFNFTFCHRRDVSKPNARSSSQLLGTLRSPRGQCVFGYLAAVMIEGVPRKCGVSVLVRLHSPPLGIELPTDIIFTVEMMHWAHHEIARRPSTGMSCPVRNSCGLEDHHNWWGERTPRYHSMGVFDNPTRRMVVRDIPHSGRFPGTTAHATMLYKTKSGYSVAKMGCRC